MLLELGDGRVWMLVRDRGGRLWQSFSPDGERWPALERSPFISSDSPAELLRLRNGNILLLTNACQAMPDGGTLRLGCEPARGRKVKVTVSDTGVGIKPEHLQRIFDLYFTTKERGSGIGLSMVYRTVQMHDGEIEVQSTPGKGTTFTVLLPQA